MKIPYVEAKDSETGQIVKGFYFEYPETTYCFTEDYEREPKVKLIPCIMLHRMTDWGLPNVPIICKPIDKSTLEIVGYIDTDNNYYIPSNYVKEVILDVSAVQDALKLNELKNEELFNKKIEILCYEILARIRQYASVQEDITISNIALKIIEVEECYRNKIKYYEDLIEQNKKIEFTCKTEEEKRNKAIDEFATTIKEALNQEFPRNYESTKPYFTLENARLIVDEIAEQMKEK